MDSFGQVLSQILDEHDVTMSELSKRLGMKSRTSLSRLTRDETTYETALRFRDRLVGEHALDFTEADLERMEQALQVKRLNPDTYRANLAIEQLLCEHRPIQEPLRVEGIPGAATFEELAQMYARFQDVVILITGLCDRRVAEALPRASKKAATPFRVFHYIYRLHDAAETIRHIDAILPMLFRRTYIPRMVAPEQTETLAYLGEMMLCRFTDADGCQHYHHLVMAGPSVMRGIVYEDAKVYQYWYDLIQTSGRELPLLKTVFSTDNTPEDYLAYAESYRQLEHDCNLYSLKPDIPINYIAPEILRQAMADSVQKSEFAHSPQLEKLIARAIRIQKQRYEHFFHRRKVAHNIYSKKAMLTFAETGYHSDHFFAIRAYTPEERVKILSHCLEADISNPYFNIYFAKNDSLIRNLEISCYEGKGTMLLNAYPSCKLQSEHSEVLIAHRGFNEHFRIYFQSELLRNQVLPVAEGREYLRHLIDVARAAQ